MKIIKIFYAILICILILQPKIAAQNNTNSPFTRYGYGQLEDDCFSKSQSMGGTSIALRSNGNINPTNPASYSSIDSTSFIFEIGVSGLVSNFRSGNTSNTSFTGNLDYVALQSPITKWMGLSLGLIPYSYVGYNYNMQDSINTPSNNGSSKYLKSYYGTGGISQVYLGLSFDIANHLALGVNGYYMFGNINNYKAISFSSSDFTTTNSIQNITLYARNFNVRFGLQYHETIGTRHALNIGAIYEFRSKMNGTYEETITSSDTISIPLKSNLKEQFELPSLYGAGITYIYDNRLTIGFDYTFQEFSKALYYGKRDSLCNRTKISIGAEYIHNPRGRNYAERIYWRLGANYRNSYNKYYNKDFNQFKSTNDFSITLGLGLPLRTSKTMINVNLEYGNIGSQRFSPLKENYFKIGVNFSINETWFVKTKLR